MDLPKNRISDYYEKYQQCLEQEQLLVAKGLGPNHPDVLSGKSKTERSLAWGKIQTRALIDLIDLKHEIVNTFYLDFCALLKDFEENVIDFPTLRQKAMALDKAFQQKLHKTEPE